MPLYHTMYTYLCILDDSLIKILLSCQFELIKKHNILQEMGERLEAERVEFTALLEAAEKERQELEHDARELDMKSSSLQVCGLMMN